MPRTMKHSPKSPCPARLFAQSFHGWMAARFLGANSVYQAQGETSVNLNKAEGNYLLATMTMHPSLDPRSPPSAGRGGISDPGLHKLTWSVLASKEATLFTGYCAIQGEHIVLVGSTGERTGALQPTPPTFLQPSPKICPEKGLLTSVQSQAGALSGLDPTKSNTCFCSC